MRYLFFNLYKIFNVHQNKLDFLFAGLFHINKIEQAFSGLHDDHFCKILINADFAFFYADDVRTQKD